MSETIKRGMRRLEAVQESRNIAWIVLLIMAPMAILSLASLVANFDAGTLASSRAVISGVILICSVWIAWHLFGETRRLGKLLKDPERIMRSERDPELVEGIQWSVLLPFFGGRN